MVDFNQEVNPPDTLRCFSISDKASFTIYKLEKHPRFYQWFRNVAIDLDMLDGTHDLNTYEVESDQILAYGTNKAVIVAGDEKIMLMFKERPDPDIMLNHLEMIEAP